LKLPKQSQSGILHAIHMVACAPAIHDSCTFQESSCMQERGMWWRGRSRARGWQWQGRELQGVVAGCSQGLLPQKGHQVAKQVGAC
jgi:hypothetical protein